MSDQGERRLAKIGDQVSNVQNYVHDEVVLDTLRFLWIIETPHVNGNNMVVLKVDNLVASIIKWISFLVLLFCYLTKHCSAV